MNDGVPSEVERVLDRDDLLTMAAAADRAVDIAARMERDDRTLFTMALQQQLRSAKQQSSWALRAQAYDYAAVIVRFADMVDEDLGDPPPAAELHERALTELRDTDSDFVLDRDMTIGVFSRYHAARNHRLSGAWDEALRLVKQPVEKLFGTGAEPHAAHYQFEVGAAYIQRGRAREVRRALQENDRYWSGTRAAGYSTRHRFVFIKALTEWAVDPAGEAVRPLLLDASARLRESREADTRQEDMGDLSVLLATAEHLAGGDPSAEQVAEAVGLGRRALVIANDVRARWKVLARSRAPLALVFERVYGDLALLADRLPGPDAAALGCLVAISAKQTGLAARIRGGLNFEGNDTVLRILEEIVDIEGSFRENLARSRESELARLRKELEADVSPMLADTVFPPPATLETVTDAVGRRYALDFVELRDTLSDQPQLFRTLIEPDGRVSFDRCRPPAALRDFYRRRRTSSELTQDIAAAGRDLGRPTAPVTAGADWRGLGATLLPERLTEELLRTDEAAPLPVLISAHSWLSLVPWAAVRIDDAGHRLVERAVIGQTPVLTSLTGEPPAVVTGTALLRLVGADEGGVDVDRERRAWGFPGGTDGVRPHRCELRPGERPSPRELPGRFADALTEKDTWQFLHIASHGAGRGFGQHLDLGAGTTDPDARQIISAAQALGLKWPEAVLMASCHVGLVENENGREPLSFVMALLLGGARCVVAGIDRIADEGTGAVAGRIVESIRGGGVPLDAALRNAQLAAVRDGVAEDGWALLNAYVG